MQAMLLLLLLFPQDPDLVGLVRRLGDESYDVREAATRRLYCVGLKALPPLKGALHSRDPEVATRAQLVWKAVLDPVIRKITETIQHGEECLDRRSYEAAVLDFRKALSMTKEVPVDDRLFNELKAGLAALIEYTHAAERREKKFWRQLRGGDPAQCELRRRRTGCLN